MAFDPLVVSRFALGRPVAVGDKCRPIRGQAVPLYASTVELLRRTAYLISAHVFAETPRVI